MTGPGAGQLLNRRISPCAISSSRVSSVLAARPGASPLVKDVNVPDVDGPATPAVPREYLGAPLAELDEATGLLCSAQDALAGAVDELGGAPAALLNTGAR